MPTIAVRRAVARRTPAGDLVGLTITTASGGHQELSLPEARTWLEEISDPDLRDHLITSLTATLVG